MNNYEPPTERPVYSLVKRQKEISPFDPPPLDGTVVVLHTLNIMIMTFCSYATILEDFFQFDNKCSYRSVAYGRPLTTKTSNVTVSSYGHRPFASKSGKIVC